jgi:hypothetical protein
MADEPVTPQEPVVDDVTPVEPAEPEPVEPQFMTTDQVAEAVSRGTNETKTWLGRRDKDLLGQIGTIIDERLSKKVETPEELSSKLLEDPVTTIKQIMSETQANDQSRYQAHNQEVFNIIGNNMDSDPLYNKEDGLGEELVEEVKKQFQSGKLNTDVSPSAAAAILQSEALANVVRNRQQHKASPLAGNAPAAGTGTLTPGATNTAKKIKMPTLQPETLALAKKWGYTDEALAKLYGSES